MTAPAELELSLDGVAPLTDPALVIALAGLFDVATVATSVLDYVVDDDAAVTIGAIDPDLFYDFTVERPTIEIVHDEVDDVIDGTAEARREIVWPANVVRIFRTSHRGGRRDLVVLNGVEPHLSWPTYIRCITSVIDRLGVGLVVTLGSAADTTPHTRMPVVVGSTADRALGARFALDAPSYQGVTGLVGVLHSELEAVGIPSVSLRVGVPHYLAAGEHPRAIVSLVRHLAHVVEVPFSLDLTGSISFWEEQHNTAIADDDQLRTYVQLLEAEYDRRAEASLATGDDLAAQFEQFLRDHPDDDPPR